MTDPLYNPYFTGVRRQCGCIIPIVIYWPNIIKWNPDSMIEKKCTTHTLEPRPDLKPIERIALLNEYDLRTENIKRMQAEGKRIVY